MTAVEVRCPHCESSYRVSCDSLGKTGRCKRCGQAFFLQAVDDTYDSLCSDTNSGGKTAISDSGGVPKNVGRFEIKEKLGEGGFGTVYRAFDPILERHVAIKVPHPHLLRKGEDRQRYLREAKAAARLRHAHMVPLHEATMDGDDLYIASAFIEGKPLDVVLRERRPGVVESVGWVIKLARALDYAHVQGVIHRDIKPGNIMLDEHGEPLLMDFGLARIIASDEQLTQSDSVLGTPAYMSPEQAAGRVREISPATDQYSLGVLLYELISGKRPFSGPVGMVISLVINTEPLPPSEHNVQVPSELELICLRMMSKQIGDRYQSLGEAAKELERYLEDSRGKFIGGGVLGLAGNGLTDDEKPERDQPFQNAADLQKHSEKPNNASDPQCIPSSTGNAAGRAVQHAEGFSKRRLALLVAITTGLVAVFVPLMQVQNRRYKNNNVLTDDSVFPRDVVVEPREKIIPAEPAPTVPGLFGAPPLAKSPFSESEAKTHQESWAAYLDQPAELTNGVGMRLMLIPPGEFLMGSPEDESERDSDETAHRVRITDPYYVGMHEVTQADFETVMGENPSFYSSGGAGKEKIERVDTGKLPVENVSWIDATEYCRRLSSMKSESSAGRVYRLPTEAEWEYACRAGTITPFSFGTQLNGHQANCDGSRPYQSTVATGRSMQRTTLVGSYKANGFGLFDMHGNVFEWCSDWYGSYGTSAIENPLGARTGVIHVLRGGAWSNESRLCRSAYRYKGTAGLRSNSLGFRVAFNTTINERIKQAGVLDGNGSGPIKSPPASAIAPFSIAVAKSHQLAWSRYLDQPVDLTNSIGMKLKLIPPGEFMMGSPESEVERHDEEVAHRVRITKPYYLGMYEVTQREYEQVMGKNPSWFSANGDGSDRINGMDTSRFPVESISWEDSVAYCRRLSALPAEHAAGRVYRLPTEAEWEFACRAGTTTPFYLGSQLTSQQANVNGSYPSTIAIKGANYRRTLAVGSYAANGYGLYDMHGNVYEWCSDWFGDYATSAQLDPLGLVPGTKRVGRGGAWTVWAGSGRSANRAKSAPEHRGMDIGFRVALSSEVER